MHLSALKLSNFKSYADLDVDFCSNVNCLVGNNGVGKTNLLDAVYYLSFCKSYFNAVDTQNIRQGEEFFAIHGTYKSSDPGLGEGSARAEETLPVSCIVRKNQPKQLKWCKKVCKTFSEHIGRIPLVIISPVDQQLILGGSEVRRKFIDGVISQTDKGYLDHLLQYQKALDQRNRLLKQFYDDRQWDEAAISVWDDQLVRHGQILYDGRRSFLNDFLPLFAEYFSWIAGSSEQAGVEYLTHADTPLQQQLVEARQSDKYALYTTVGPHKDDLEFTIGPFSVKRFGSQGQQKTFMMALKLAQFEYIYRRRGVKPILLLDDIFDKLDLLRVTQLIQLVGSDRFGQVFLTDTQPGRVEQVFNQIPQVDHRIFTVTPGTLEPTNNSTLNN